MLKEDDEVDFSFFFLNDHLQSTSKLIKANRQSSVRSLNVSKIELN